MLCTAVCTEERAALSAVLLPRDCRADRGTLTPALVKIASGVTTGELALWVGRCSQCGRPCMASTCPRFACRACVCQLVRSKV